MSLLQRRIVLALLVGLMFFDAVALNPVGPWSDAPSWNWSSFWLGDVLAQVSLLATWAALRRRPWFEWLPPLLGLACLYGFVVEGVAARYPINLFPPLQGIVFVAPPLFLTLVFVLRLLRRFRGWEIVVPEEMASAAEASERVPVQYSLRHLFLWLTGAAICLAMGVWLVRFPQPAWQWQSPLVLASATGVGAFLALFSLPILLPCVGLMLAERGRRWFALVLLLVVILGLPWVVLVPSLRQVPGRVNWNDWAIVGSINLGFVSVCGGVLAIARLCGYRLRRGRTSVETDSPSLPRPRFGLVVGLLVLVFLVLCWPAVRQQEIRRWLMICQEWQQTGVTANFGPGEGISLQAKVSQPLPQATLDRLAVPEYAAQITGIYLIRSPSIDAQMPRLATLGRLETVLLDGSDLTDAGLASLQGLKQLRYLDLRDTRVTAEGVAELQRALPDCQIIAPPPGPAAGGEESPK